jgi:hypothetical protein
MADILQVRRDTAANWTSVDPTLAEGELGIETDTSLIKIGNGSDEWSALNYLTTQGETGLQGAAGAAGATGETGLQGAAGAAGATGAQGVTGIDLAVYDAGTFGTTGATINFSNGYNQEVTLVAGGETGVLYVGGMVTGQKGTVKFDYDANVVPVGSTGIKWANGLFPTLSGQTGIEDLGSFYFNGTSYYGQISLGYNYV